MNPILNKIGTIKFHFPLFLCPTSATSPPAQLLRGASLVAMKRVPMFTPSAPPVQAGAVAGWILTVGHQR